MSVRKVDLCSRAVPDSGTLLLPSCPCGLHGLFRWLTAVVLLLTFKKMACCNLAFSQGSISKPTSSVGQHHQPSGVWTENLEALVSIIHLGGLCKMHRIGKKRVEGRLPLLSMGKNSFVNADMLPEFCIWENGLENFSSRYFYFECSKPLLAATILLGGPGRRISTQQILTTDFYGTAMSDLWKFPVICTSSTMVLNMDMLSNVRFSGSFSEKVTR